MRKKGVSEPAGYSAAVVVNPFITGRGFVTSSTVLTLKRYKESPLTMKFRQQHLPCWAI